ncbi:hypothetical protein D9758_014144 [Tetrapyrgos nigripes]|uniref:Chromo domain-containing protein n=1 Tax=Tetrapyrgos nigripes TaxID=182062 RepID=A0A8H5CMD7_9AGAR|nr:hypothetical protein D9758_014144 [Tetrapyrgos nigripes]
MPVRTNNSAPEQPVVHIDTDSTGGADTDSEKDPLLGDEGNSESESEAEAIPEKECIIAGILRHQWSWSELMFEVAWEDGDVTWQDLTSVDDCLALDEYLKKQGVEKPSDLI